MRRAADDDDSSLDSSLSSGAGVLLLSLPLVCESWRESSGRESSDDCRRCPSSSDPLPPTDADEAASFGGVGSDDSVRESIVSLLMILFTTCELL